MNDDQQPPFPNFCYQCRALHERIENLALQNKRDMESLMEALGEKMDKLIDAVSGKKQVPLNTFNYIIGAIILLLFVERFGAEFVIKILGAL